MKELPTIIKDHKFDRFTNVIFSDETGFILNKKTRKVYVFEEITDQFLNILVWGAISQKSTIALHFPKDSINKFT